MMKSNINHREADDHIGTHIVADFWGCEFSGSATEFKDLLVKAAKESNSNILDSIEYQFKPDGATALLLLAESHISIHTWPEYQYIAVDVFTCGKSMKPDRAIAYIESQLRPNKSKIQTIPRGIN